MNIYVFDAVQHNWLKLKEGVQVFYTKDFFCIYYAVFHAENIISILDSALYKCFFKQFSLESCHMKKCVVKLTK